MMAYLDTEAGKACCKLIGDVARDVKLQGVGSAFAFRKEDTAPARHVQQGA